MDIDAERKRLENEQAVIRSYLDHPITQRILKDSAEEQESLLNLILDHPVVSVETFFAREQALGHLRGLRRAKAIITDDLVEIEETLKNLK